MKTVSRILILEGLVLIVFGLLTSVFTGPNTFYVMLFGGLGLGSLVVGIFIDFNDLWKSLRGRSGVYGSMAIIYTLIFLAVLVFANIIANNHPKRFDVTGVGIHTLSEQSQTVVANLPGPAEIVGFFKAGESREFEALAERYQNLSDKISYEAIDPDLRPDQVQKYAITERGAIAVSCEGRTNITMDMSEQGITLALLKVSAPATGLIYYLEGHGEIPLEGKEERGFGLLKEGLENENRPVRSLLLISENKIPDNAAMLIINGPTNKYVPEEVELLRNYLNGGGRMLITVDPLTETGLEPLLVDYGIAIDNNIVVEPQMRMFQGAVAGYDPVVVDYGFHEITKKMGENPTVFHLARSLTISKENRLDGVVTDPILRSGMDSWGETDFTAFANGEDPARDETADDAGPLVIGAASERTIGEGEDRKSARLVVIGDADFNNNHFVAYGFNANLFLNTINWLTGQEAYISVRPNTFAPDVFTLTEEETGIIFLASVVILPLAIIMLGIGVALFRKR